MTDFLPITDAPRSEPLRLLVQGQQRLGQWDETRGAWVSVVDNRVRLRPTHWKPWPIKPVDSARAHN